MPPAPSGARISYGPSREPDERFIGVFARNSTSRDLIAPGGACALPIGLFWSVRIDYNSHMRRASVSELKTSLSDYLRGVKNGEEVLVTERGRPIARLVPAVGAEGASDRKKRLVRAGTLRPGSRKLSPQLLKPSPVLDAEGKILQGLLEERRGGP